LFGPTTENGFGELSAYDEDGNDFIDEGDSIYQQLRIWQKDADGEDRLIALGQAGVGAIYLGSVATPFQVKDIDNQLLGAVQHRGLSEGAGRRRHGAAARPGGLKRHGKSVSFFGDGVLVMC
jgi:hypothetical protein